jgi:hypothetical protein
MCLLERPRRAGTAENPLGALLELVVINFGNQEAGVKVQQLSHGCQSKLKIFNLIRPKLKETDLPEGA